MIETTLFWHRADGAERPRPAERVLVVVETLGTQGLAMARLHGDGIRWVMWDEPWRLLPRVSWWATLPALPSRETA